MFSSRIFFLNYLLRFPVVSDGKSTNFYTIPKFIYNFFITLVTTY